MHSPTEIIVQLGLYAGRWTEHKTLDNTRDAGTKRWTLHRTFGVEQELGPWKLDSTLRIEEDSDILLK